MKDWKTVLVNLYLGLFKFQTNHHFLRYSYLPQVHAIWTMNSIYITVGLAIERCHAVETPYKYQAPHHKNSVKRLLKYTIPILIASIVFNIPDFYSTQPMSRIHGNSSHSEHSIVFYNYYYHLWYKAVARLLIVAVIPFVVFIVMNFRIYFAIRKIRNASSISVNGCMELEQVNI